MKKYLPYIIGATLVLAVIVAWMFLAGHTKAEADAAKQEFTVFGASFTERTANLLENLEKIDDDVLQVYVEDFEFPEDLLIKTDSLVAHAYLCGVPGSICVLSEPVVNYNYTTDEENLIDHYTDSVFFYSEAASGHVFYEVLDCFTSFYGEAYKDNESGIDQYYFCQGQGFALVYFEPYQGLGRIVVKFVKE